MHELRSKSPSPYSLCGSVVEHWSSKAQLEFLMGTQIFFLTHARDKTKNIILYFFTELKTYHLFYSIY